ncbi:MAG: PadR family transcriptional regulator [Chloroflexota bacterium]|nr:MAG: PadR family transcriptional regulator [Chloroflexota bacterium]
MPVKHALLGILSQGERHGYDLKADFDRRVGDLWDLNYGQIYTTLDRLEREGFIEGFAVEQQGRPDKRIYRITPRGREELARWLVQPIDRPRPLRDEIFVKLLFLDQSNPTALLDLIERQRSLYLRQMAQLTQRKYELTRSQSPRESLISSLLIDAGLYHAEADVRWLNHCEARIRAAVGNTSEEERR